MRIRFLFIVVAAVAFTACTPARKAARENGKTIHIRESSGMCFLGSSDPTINRGNALGLAAQDALRNLFVGVTPTEDKSAWVNLAENLRSPDRNEQMIINRLRKNMAGGRIVGWWLDRKGVGPRGKCDGRCRRSTAWAVACLEGHEQNASRVLPEAFKGKIPGWMKNPASTSNHICSLGFSGPTQMPEDAQGYALGNARYMLATALCGMGDHSFIDYMSGWGGTHDFPETKPSSAAIAHVDSMKGTQGETVDLWLDEKGVGPLGDPGTAYARVCIPRVDLPCGNLASPVE